MQANESELWDRICPRNCVGRSSWHRLAGNTAHEADTVERQAHWLWSSTPGGIANDLRI